MLASLDANYHNHLTIYGENRKNLRARKERYQG
jgi:hypothetical protein